MAAFCWNQSHNNIFQKYAEDDLRMKQTVSTLLQSQYILPCQVDLCKTILGTRLKVGSAAVCYENFPFSPAFPLKGCTQVLFFREKPFLPPQL